MILKKPYAILIKYFKLIHVFITVLIAYSIFKINGLLKFFNTYLDNQTSVVGQNLKENLFTTFMIIVPLLVFIISILLLWLMVRKKKPYKFYLINTLIYIYNYILLIYVSLFLSRMEVGIVSVVSVRVVRDLLSISIFLQSVSLIISFIRAIGFDIKNFEFGADLEKLEISEEDQEEYELEFSFDSNERKRRRKRKLRYLKYTYRENKIFVNVLLALLFGVICYFVYKNMGIYSKTNKEGNILSTKYYNMGVENSYLINKNYKGNIITNNYILVVNLKVRSISNRNKLITGNFKLEIGDNTYLTTNYYDKSLLDLGKVYDNDIVSSEYNNYLLVYEIKKEDINNKNIKLIYYENNKNIKFKLKPIIYNDNCQEEYSIGEDIKLPNSTVVNISSYDIQERYKIDYEYCIKDNCYNSIQYLVSTLDTNYDKAIIKIVGSANIQKNNIYNSFNKLLSNTSTIYYTINGINKKTNITKINNIKKEDKNVYYYEVNKELMSADNIKLVFNTRECKYLYNFK